MRVRVPFKNLTGPIPPSRLAEGGTGFLVVDCHRFTLSPDSGYGRLAREHGIFRELGEYYEQLDQALPNLRRLLAECRQRDLPVFFTRLVGDPGNPGSVAAQAVVTGFWATESSAEADFLPDLAPRPGETILDKTTVSAFADTNLHERLRVLGVRHLLVAGVLANNAVELTAREAADLGYNVVIVSDACAAETWTLHTLVMTTVVGGLMRVRTVEAVLEMLDGRRL
jgi:ureidoacrylate peracid hydrolase